MRLKFNVAVAYKRLPKFKFKDEINESKWEAMLPLLDPKLRAVRSSLVDTSLSLRAHL
jgi:hypothetical protein